MIARRQAQTVAGEHSPGPPPIIRGDECKPCACRIIGQRNGRSAAARAPRRCRPRRGPVREKPGPRRALWRRVRLRTEVFSIYGAQFFRAPQPAARRFASRDWQEAGLSPSGMPDHARPWTRSLALCRTLCDERAVKALMSGDLPVHTWQSGAPPFTRKVAAARRGGGRTGYLFRRVLIAIPSAQAHTLAATAELETPRRARARASTPLLTLMLVYRRSPWTCLPSCDRGRDHRLDRR